MVVECQFRKRHLHFNIPVQCENLHIESLNGYGSNGMNLTTSEATPGTDSFSYAPWYEGVA